MNTVSEETPEDGKQRRKSIGTPGLNITAGKTRRYSIGITSSRKGIEEEGKTIPNYLRASTGSCHDFCKYGKHHEHSKSSIPIKFKRPTAVNKEKLTKTIVPPEIKETTPVAKIKPIEPIEITKKDSSLPSKKPQAFKRSFSTNGKATENEVKVPQRSASSVKSRPMMVNPSSGLNGGIKKKEVKPVKKTEIPSKTAPVKKVVPVKESKSPKASFSRAASLKSIKYKSAKQVAPLKDQNRMQKTEKVNTKALQGLEIESEVKPEVKPEVKLEVEPEVKPEVKPDIEPETIEFDFSQPAIEIEQPMELINASVSENSETVSEKNDVEEELTMTHPVNESSEILEELSISPPVVEVESSQSSSDKEILEEDDSLIDPQISESSQSLYDDEVLEDESEYTDEEEEIEAFEEDSEIIDNEKAFVSENNKFTRKGRMVISEEKDEEGVKLRFRRGKILDVKSENNVPRRLKFRKGKVMEGNLENSRIVRRSFETKYVEDINDDKNGPESVVLKHQGEQEKKDAQGLFNNVIEETASKLVESRKSKVKALVGAFETVISLQDGKPSAT